MLTSHSYTKDSYIYIYILASIFLTSFTSLSFLSLTSNGAFADESVTDDVSITVPIACTMSGTGMTSHTATVNPGTYARNIGTTTLKVFCNDNAGFAIYAAGYTGDEIGGTNSNKLVGTNNPSETIPTGIATSGTSQWAMKLATSANATYPITIDSAPNTAGGSDAPFGDNNATGENNYHTVPNEYVKVAHRASSTDIGTNAIGAELTTTYAAYISSDQVADTYAGKVIYTMVHPSTAPVPGSQLIMQEVATWGSTVAAGQEVEVVDSRDGKSYTVARLADGNLWMTQNLDFDIGSTTLTHNSATLYADDTDLPSGTTWTPSTATYASSNTTWNYSASTPESYDPGTLYWNGTVATTEWDDYYDSCDYSGSTPVCNESLNPAANGTLTSSTGNSHYHLGNYYNWTAAIAMNDSSSYTADQTLVDQSVCPAGWTLPRAGVGEDTFQALWTEYGYDSSNYSFSDVSTLTGSPTYFAPTGYWYGSFGGAGAFGNFWSPVVLTSDYAYLAAFDMYGGAHPSGNFLRGFGNSIRCVARPVTSTLEWGSGGGDEE